ncbi:MAG TPA: Mut7-C RNAse domain-containing protein [Nitrososphaerales archaeon]|nr:Mut7-C RNAse domain-containing protein [Nitrososphaerales archaeon]
MATGGSRSTRFAVDAMLGSLARKLRAFGFDSVYYKDATDSAILSASARQGRVLVTADRQLAWRAGKRGLRAFLVSGGSDRSRLLQIIASARESGVGLRRGEPRCSLCNGALVVLAKAEARGRVPESVARRHRLFFACSSCGRVYWRGGHWKKLRSLEELFERQP